ncbi:hypothetical protein ABB37_02959 [Leptomonas pyrrhocoris]|uniref:Uncharacterized protein n=1 Tax=Leptomonas pyrrhocoris TaxID=157538 RepID=A0A0N1J554_LEPPY|nr:hypothetical protein ABB37_02959 [Leptomonas pyrrhocoris]XP_015661732.1 hypothetical protein ABB37_02959 [Leptomonas pyrrhocoris]XP_015661733.1 hypothetical protein ABB37_02959 [Leptomonas pyrrhocoris]XP_015661734.1 hypothetical protein ABB37_02959 [Leptomonas pyrrhocoris]KPA83292.1 hypothetical protein ABB37_02959 [Leptomonas pyrrhocoris]KPA83293.1 hypothetical protein ABB37_02959 [Leptomonas pyrrhocoris]KPA83294.1 hypothetical protein ABB37_02959 [Leptomonas pyrrhocoris]KPA83295.1 hypot|eukprot:XP_015661731.1 hypothetical protein ABB37_02959 [Leptomonas pyrrhocoris]
MPAPAAHTLFGLADLKVNARFLSNVAFMASADKPVETPTLIGDYAMSEMCVSKAETEDLKMYLGTLRSDGQKKFVSQVVEKLRAAAAQTRNRAVAAAADTIESDFAHLAKVFFLRVRSYEVIKVSADKSVGRIVCFPDQISDDYGNNLEEHNETGIIQSLVDRSHNADKLPTVYVGHGHGAAMAEVCGCATGRQSIIFDGSILSTLLVLNAVTHKCVLSEPGDDDVPHEFNLMNYRTEATITTQDAIIKPIQTAAEEVLAEEKAEEEAAAEEANKNGGGKKEEKADAESKKKEDEQQKAAMAWFDNRVWHKIGGIVSPAASNHFERTGRYNAKALSDMLLDYTASVRPAEDPFKQE